MQLKRNPILFIGILFLIHICELPAQKYDFRQFGPPGLPDKVIYSISQDNNGFLWVGTATGLFRFDGFVFRKVGFPDSTSIRFATSLFKDSRGVMWVGGSDGTIHHSSEDGLSLIDGVTSQRINDINESPGGDIYAVTQDNGIFVISGSDKMDVSHLAPPPGQLLYSICFVDENHILAGTQEGLLFLSIGEESLSIEDVVEGIEYTKVTGVIPINDGRLFYAGTDYNGIYKVIRSNGDYSAMPLSDDEELAYLRVQSLFIDREKNIWASTYGSGVIKFYPDESGLEILNEKYYNSSTGLSGDDARLVFQDSEGNFWIGLYGDGLNQLVSEAFTFYQPGISNENNNINYIGAVKSQIILGTPSGYHFFDLFTERSMRFESVLRATDGKPATTYLTEDDGTVWIGTGGSGLFVKKGDEPVRQFYKTSHSGENYISGISLSGRNLWLATRNGVIVIDRFTGSRVRSFTTLDKLPHNYINQVFIDKDGAALIATEAVNLYTADIDSGIIPGNIEIAGTVRNAIQGFTQSPDGSFWLATIGNGVFYLHGDSVNTLNSSDGMMSNYCYSILADSKEKLWVGHERGFSRYDRSTGSMAVYSTSFAGGGDCNTNAIFESAEGIVFIGTTNGVIVYDRTKDLKGELAPYNNIHSVTVNDKVYPYRQIIQLPFNRYVIRIDYVGISLSNPELVKYRYKLENYDIDWSDPGSLRHVTYRLTDGTFRFSLESFNEVGTNTVSDYSLAIIVKKPYWRRWWFILIAVTVLFGGVVVFIRIREENQRRMRAHLENELQERTREVVKQKEEIEQQNNEITDSINYARRIQSSILPDVLKLKDSFGDAFIVFIPRDIVSGDFYWFEKLDDDRFILACADSTGHGVPGAFMSMIGSTLLQDIVTRKSVTRPSEVLSLLDKQIFSTLNRNIDVGVSNDGMDMVVCEFNLKTRHLRFASAMRPVILIMDGEPIYIKGNRSSVGGVAYSDKYFDDQEYYLADGDALYLFSDGFPDQFGGVDGKKMKIARLKKLIEEIIDIPMDKQKEYITNFFYDWKGDHDQVDDILFMGIRF